MGARALTRDPVDTSTRDLAMNVTPSHRTPQASVTSNASVPRPIRVLLVDDHPAVRLGMRQLIDGQPDMRVVQPSRTPARR